METPIKQARPRPVSEQLLGKNRPQAMHEEELGVVSVLDAATNDLEHLTNVLDLEATPGTPDRSTIKPSLSSAEKIALGMNPGESPVRKRVLALESPVKNSGGFRTNISSASSPRPYAQTRSRSSPAPQAPAQGNSDKANLIGQQIAPWPTVDWANAPSRAALKPVNTPSTQPLSIMSHKRTLTPAPEADPPPVFEPLRPPKKTNKNLAPVKSSSSGSSLATQRIQDGTIRSPPSLTFGSGRKSKGSSDGDTTPTPSPAFIMSKGPVRQRSSLVADKQTARDGLTIHPEARLSLGFSGSMGPAETEDNEPFDPSNPDSDIFGELRDILEGRSDGASADDTFPYRPEDTDGSPVSASMGRPPQIPLPSITNAAPSPFGLPQSPSSYLLS